MKRFSRNIKPLQIAQSDHSEQEQPVDELLSPLPRYGSNQYYFPPTASVGSIDNESMVPISSSSSTVLPTGEPSQERGDRFDLPDNVSISSWDDIEILGLIGSGSTSIVHLARDRSRNVLIALKLISLYRDNKTKEMLLDEINTLLRTDCDALVSFYGITYREGQVAIALEYLNLGSLNQLLQKLPFHCIPESILAAIGFQILWGIAYLHHDHIIHRDIKPQNVLLNTYGQVKLSDFGISKVLETTALARTFIGSFKYMSPERVLHEAYDYSADIWSLGIILIEAASQFPYEESNMSQLALIMAIVDTVPELPERSPLNEKFSASFHDFLRLCVAKNPQQRASAVTLLEHPWLTEEHDVTTLDDAINRVHTWLDSMGLTKDPLLMNNGDDGDDEERWNEEEAATTLDQRSFNTEDYGIMSTTSTVMNDTALSSTSSSSSSSSSSSISMTIG